MRNFFEAPPLVAIFRGIMPDSVCAIGNAVIDAGFRIVEVTLNSPDHPLQSLQKLVALQRADVIIGAGTVTTPEEVDAVADLGVRLIVSPNTNARVIRRTKERGLLSLPGCLTPTEAFTAIEAGADGLKIFPCELCSAKALHALKEVLPGHIPIFAVGDIRLDNMKNYFMAGADGFGFGASLFRPGKAAADVNRDAKEFFHCFGAIQKQARA